MSVHCQYLDILFLLRHNIICVVVRIGLVCLSCSAADAVSSGSRPILFKLLILSVVVSTVLLHLSDFLFGNEFEFSSCLHYVLRTSIDLMKEYKFTLKKNEADDTPNKLFRSQTMQMTLRFLQIHLPKPNPCCVVWSRQQVPLASTWMQSKRSTYMSIKK